MKAFITLVVVSIATVMFMAWSGTYNISAKDPHWKITYEFLELVKERSIETRAEDIEVPNLDDKAFIEAGAEDYAEMCADCHLAPGMQPTELHQGLYPQPPVFSNGDESEEEPEVLFWVIKNGIKMTGMPAWSPPHSDEQVWNMVAFIKKLDGMSPSEYQALTGVDIRGLTGHGHPEHSHDDGIAEEHHTSTMEPEMAVDMDSIPASSNKPGGNNEDGHVHTH